jgi:hypothetical protein
MAGLEARIERLAEAGLLGGRTIEAAACEFHALCEGLAAIELRGLIHDGDEAPIWRDALGAFVAGLGRTPSTLTPGALLKQTSSNRALRILAVRIPLPEAALTRPASSGA